MARLNESHSSFAYFVPLSFLSRLKFPSPKLFFRIPHFPQQIAKSVSYRRFGGFLQQCLTIPGSLIIKLQYWNMAASKTSCWWGERPREPFGSLARAAQRAAWWPCASTAAFRPHKRPTCPQCVIAHHYPNTHYSPTEAQNSRSSGKFRLPY
jgi:hypothetical protein